MKEEKGFTLVELLVVISIITLLASLVVVLVTGVMERARNSKTFAFVKSLDQVCHAYKTVYNVFPPDNTHTGSANLHFYLGRDRTEVTQYNNDGTAVTVQKKPFMEFTRDQLMGNPPTTYPNSPVQLMDAYGGAIQYKNPGVNVPKGVDIWSFGKDQTPDGTPTGGDDIGNWMKDF